MQNRCGYSTAVFVSARYGSGSDSDSARYGSGSDCGSDCCSGSDSCSDYSLVISSNFVYMRPDRYYRLPRSLTFILSLKQKTGQ